MTEYLFTSSAVYKVIESLRKKPRILAFDFDGTLAPIAASPEDVVIPANLPFLLEKLAGDGNTCVAVVSGRAIADLKRMIGIPSIIFFGNHGITSSVDGFGAKREDLLKWSREALKVHKKLSRLEQIYKGCLIENKGPVVSVHYRKVDAEKVKELLSDIRNISAEFEVDIQGGKMVTELKPRTHFTKGTALSELAAGGFSGWRTGDAFLFAGDDYTDEDGFRVIKHFGPESLGLKIGEGDTAADYRLFDGEIIKLIEMILQEEL
jgi:trehalose 6-phosphate phosphatase